MQIMQMSPSSQALPLPRPAQRDASFPGGFRRGGWIVLCILATLLGIVSLRYLLPHVPFPVRNSNFALRRPWLVTHVVTASIALLVGPWQFVKGLRTKRRELHRRIGWTYMIAVLIGWISSIPVALHAPSGVVTQAGYLGLGAAWITTSALGLLTAMNRHFEQHRRWMTRSYALSCSAITLRLILPISLISGMPFRHAEPLSVWSAWLLNLCIAQYLLKSSTGSVKRSQAAAPALQQYS